MLNKNKMGEKDRNQSSNVQSSDETDIRQFAIYFSFLLFFPFDAFSDDESYSFM